jgi:phosphatidate cytidylyltransferase
VSQSARDVKSSAFSKLPQRVVSSLIAFTGVVLLVWLGWPTLTLMLIAATLLGLHEFRNMARRKGMPIGGRSIYGFGVLMILASEPWMKSGFWFVPANVPWREIVMWLYFTWVMTVEVIRPSERPLERIMTSLFGMLYIPFLLSFALLLRFEPNGALGFWYLIVTIVGAYASDSGAYFVGGTIGRRKLAPEISPGKTLEGAIGGLAFSFLVVFVFVQLLRSIAPETGLIEIGIFSLLVSSAAQLGDLAESIVKRSFGVKDSGSFLPGHGGLLDRIDSTLFALPVAYYFLSVAVFN